LFSSFAQSLFARFGLRPGKELLNSPNVSKGKKNLAPCLCKTAHFSGRPPETVARIRTGHREKAVDQAGKAVFLFQPAAHNVAL